MNKAINLYCHKLLLGLLVSAQLLVFSATAAEPNQMSLTNLQSMGTTQTTLPNASLENGSYSKAPRDGIMLPGEMTAAELLPVSEIGLPPPFGANLFAGGYESERIDGLNEDYTIAPGDKVSIWLWGAINQSEVITVDNQGNLFITNVGPVYVADVKASQLNNFVSQKIKQVYKNSVEIYVNLLTATPVSVYISGSVIRPGQYAGIASDSILYYLKRAGGIDSERGSYRSIKVLRQNQVVQEIDLYDFMLKGYLPKFNFKDNDVILVERQKATVVVSGSVRNPFRFEFTGNQADGQQLAKFALPLAKVSHVGIVGDRSDGPFSVYLPYNDFETFNLRDGDRVIFNDDIRAQVFDIQISGSYLGPSYFAVKKETRLHDLLAQIEVDKNLTDYESIYIQRKSVATKQKEMIDQSLERLERSVFTAPASSDGEAKIRAEEGKMILEFTERARKIMPLGKVVISDQGKVANIQLEQGDIVFIPAKTDLIQVGGEVLMPQALVFNKNASVEDYIAWAGGYSERANYEQIMVIHPNGMIDLNAKGPLRAGDQILVLPKVDAKIMQSIKDVTQIIYQIAIAANVAT
ncbi:polysaccharide biosynthesis/export family protein [Shewanella saliphila]|uniref:Capreomycidine hydroxylase n=1 Tax=Shewanella saliphila TaxID=2282698 RepID=A0ABQ2Q148_9GAMM|nr:polysaccharide biosynthesis/export family protein [Shewanella saliphila]MCL1100417.1 polysaccharide export protein [Shewanella saliphila]GGP39909.1 capreomycidine hydroxylase [Shewanella saliphila]